MGGVRACVSTMNVDLRQPPKGSLQYSCVVLRCAGPWTAAVTVSIDGHCSGLLGMVHIARCVTSVPSGASSSYSSGSLPTTRYPSRSYRRWASVLTRSPAGR